MLSDDSNMNANEPPATHVGFSSSLIAFSKHSASGPWGVIMLCRVAPPGWKPVSFASYLPVIRPMNSLIQFPRTLNEAIGSLWHSSIYDDSKGDERCALERTIEEERSRNQQWLYRVSTKGTSTPWRSMDPREKVNLKMKLLMRNYWQYGPAIQNWRRRTFVDRTCTGHNFHAKPPRRSRNGSRRRYPVKDGENRSRSHLNCLK